VRGNSRVTSGSSTASRARIDARVEPASTRRGLVAHASLITTALLISVVLLGAALRFTGIDWGRPFVYHPDEGTIVKTAMRMVATPDWNPHDFNYPSLVIDVQAGIVAIGHILAGWSLQTDQAWLFVRNEALPEQFDAFLAGRVVVAALGLATVVVTFLIGRKLGGRIAGLLAAVVVAVAPIHIESSRFATTDVPLTLLCALVLLASIRASEMPDRALRWVIAAGLVGLATSAKWNGLAVAIVPFSLFLASRPSGQGGLMVFRSRTPWLMLLAAGGALFLTTPAVVLAPGEVATWLQQQVTGYGVAKGPGVSNGLLLQIGSLTEGFGPIGFALSVIGWLGLVTRRRRVEFSMALFIAVYVVILSLPVLHFPRHSLPALPFVAVGIGLLPGRLAAIGRNVRPLRGDLGRKSQFKTLSRLTATLLILLAMVPVVGRDVTDARRLRAQDTRSVAYAWIIANLPRNAIVAREQYTPQLSPEQFRLRNHDGLYQRNMAWYREVRVQYLIASSEIYGRNVDNPATPFRSDFYREVFALPEVFRIDPGENRPGPTIRIFRLDP
jgi:4-amino-4-deoxy-L-arabinose transferase-like glycosyltransferase